MGENLGLSHMSVLPVYLFSFYYSAFDFFFPESSWIWFLAPRKEHRSLEFAYFNLLLFGLLSWKGPCW